MNEFLIAILVFGAIVSIPWHKPVRNAKQKTKRHHTSRAREDYALRAILGDLTPAEKHAVIDQEREAHNKAASGQAFWCGSEDYIDYDGYRRNIVTNKIVR